MLHSTSVMDAHRDDTSKAQARAAIEAYRSYLLAIARAENTTINHMAEEIGRSASTLNRYITRDAKKLPEIETVQALWKRYRKYPPPPEVAITLEAGLSEPEIEPLAGDLAGEVELASAQSTWVVREATATTLGYIPDDRFILDQSGLELREGDHLVVNIRDDARGTARTVIRVLKGDYLMPPNPISDDVLHRDHRKVEIMGVIVRSWRERR